MNRISSNPSQNPSQNPSPRLNPTPTAFHFSPPETELESKNTQRPTSTESIQFNQASQTIQTQQATQVGVQIHEQDFRFDTVIAAAAAPALSMRKVSAQPTTSTGYSALNTAPLEAAGDDENLNHQDAVIDINVGHRGVSETQTCTFFNRTLLRVICPVVGGAAGTFAASAAAHLLLEPSDPSLELIAAAFGFGIGSAIPIAIDHLLTRACGLEEPTCADLIWRVSGASQNQL